MKGLLSFSAALLLALCPLASYADAPTPSPTPGVDLGSDDPKLKQVIAEDEEIRHDKVVLDAGHIDLGPRVVDGKFVLMARDDTAALKNGKPVWRYLDDMVIKVTDKSLLPVPDDKHYSFVDAKPGQQVWVIPQTEMPGVVWLGWNTQDPAFTRAVQRGVTLQFKDVRAFDGGAVSMFIQPGNFAPPQMLWDGKKAADIWVDLNTHTHVNWVFTKPGIYLARVAMKAKSVNNEEVRAEAVMRLAVGDKTSTDKAANALWPGVTDTTQKPTTSPEAASSSPSELSSNLPSAKPEVERPNSSGGGMMPWLIGGLGGCAVLGAVVVVWLRRRQEKIDSEVFGDEQ